MGALSYYMTVFVVAVSPFIGYIVGMLASSEIKHFKKYFYFLQPTMNYLPVIYAFLGASYSYFNSAAAASIIFLFGLPVGSIFYANKKLMQCIISVLLFAAVAVIASLA